MRVLLIKTMATMAYMQMQYVETYHSVRCVLYVYLYTLNRCCVNQNKTIAAPLFCLWDFTDIFLTKKMHNKRHKYSRAYANACAYIRNRVYS